MTSVGRSGAKSFGDSESLSHIYESRFSDLELRAKADLWQILCDDFFQQYVPEDGTVLDLGAGSCEFINAIRARKRIAVDLNPDCVKYAHSDVTVHTTSSTNLSEVASGSLDTVFTSNFFEHLPSREALLETLAESRRVLNENGRIVILMPNIRNLPGSYWDYLDHTLPLTQYSLSEALELSGFQPTRVVPRFLPYTVKNRALPPKPLFVRTYLKLPIAWKLLGKQMLVIARPQQSVSHS